jgi:serine-type D-Ala-D-Ala carboxypeptidase (penicillin-binding protein 5/6)
VIPSSTVHAVTRQAARYQNHNANADQKVPLSEIRLAKILLDKPAPHTSAQCWAIYDRAENKLLFGKLEKERREVASLTKIMSAYTIFRLAETFQIDIETQLVEIQPKAARTPGTSADLVAGDKLTVLQLMYGLMLPSGNDAAIALSLFFGGLLLEEKIKQEEIEAQLLKEKEEAEALLAEQQEMDQND